MEARTFEDAFSWFVPYEPIHHFTSTKKSVSIAKITCNA